MAKIDFPPQPTDDVTKIIKKKKNKSPEQIKKTPDLDIEELEKREDEEAERVREEIEQTALESDNKLSPEEKKQLDKALEKAEFITRLTKYDDEEENEEESDKIENSIKAKKSNKKPTTFLERDLPEEEKQEKYLKDLQITLKKFKAKEVSEEDFDKILNSKTDFPRKIKRLLNLAKANKIDDVILRERIFNKIYDELTERRNFEIRKAFEDVSEKEGLSTQEKRDKIAEKTNAIDDKYNIVGLYEYMDIGEEKGGTFSLD